MGIHTYVQYMYSSGGAHAHAHAHGWLAVCASTERVQSTVRLLACFQVVSVIKINKLRN